MESPPLISIEGLRKTYSTDEVETIALDGVSLTVPPGDFVAVMGPSGCGKSTLLNILGLLDTPSGGSYRLAERETAGMAERERAAYRLGTVGFVFQNFNLIEDLTVEENVELPLLYLGTAKDERAARTKAALERVGIAHRRGHRPGQLSGGQRQRVAIARAVVAGPELILADEPTGNLDSSNGEAVMELLAELNGAGTTVVMVTHSETDAEHASRVVNLFDGKVVGREEVPPPAPKP